MTRADETREEAAERRVARLDRLGWACCCR